jgi:hypothetical protein
MLSFFLANLVASSSDLSPTARKCSTSPLRGFRLTADDQVGRKSFLLPGCDSTAGLPVLKL